ncbi:hypothetical protein FACS1894167_05410 [Synergistales bacterium]|nr:hypothetical protein FACS1894167_05410 [Synergistales bacterium]
MRDYIKEIADKLMLGNAPVILYGAGSDSARLIAEMKSRYSVLPTCICDRDKSKQGKQLSGVDVLSLEDAISAHPNALFFVASRTYGYQIIGELTERENISSANIINFEPVEKRLSCVELERSLRVSTSALYFCCFQFGQNQSPIIEFGGDYDKAPQEFTKYRNELINNINSGFPTPCDGCPHLVEDYFPARRNIKLIAHGSGGICNFNCIYCTFDAKNIYPPPPQSQNAIDFIKIIDAFESYGLLSDNYSIDVGAGEVTISPRREELYKLLEKSECCIFTNASVYDEKLAHLLKKCNAILDVSLDSGTRETFRVIKGVDLFGRVCKNLMRYNQEKPGCLVLKYILLPGFNDNVNDIDGFLKLCDDVEVRMIQISTDIYSTSPMSDHAKNMLCYLADKIKEKGFLCSVVSNVARRVLSERD